MGSATNKNQKKMVPRFSISSAIASKHIAEAAPAARARALRASQRMGGMCVCVCVYEAHIVTSCTLQRGAQYPTF